MGKALLHHHCTALHSPGAMLKRTILLLLILLGQYSFAQLPDFNLTVTPSPQTCLGNGSLSFSTSGTQPGATMSYVVYQLPNTTTPVWTGTGTTVTNLIAGNYQVVATQSLGGESNTATANATIINQAQPLALTLVPTHVKCGTDGVIDVNVTSGVPVSYEIISGPVTFPSQTSDIFSNLPIGQYQVRVTDNCGDVLVVTVQLTQIPTMLVYEGPVFPAGPLPSCGLITVDHFFATLTGNSIFWPLTFQYTVYPPGGGTPTVVTTVVPTGNLIDNHVISNIPFYNDEGYEYDFVVTDVCGNTLVDDHFEVNPKIDFKFIPDSETCGNWFFTFEPTHYTTPYTINFLSAPAGFNPSDFNSQHPTFSTPDVTYGSDAMPVPVGTYEVELTDNCGNTVVRQFEISNEVEPTVISSSNPNTCLGQVGITIDGRDIDSVIITSAPAAYTPVPDDVSEYVLPDVGFFMTGLPLGTYIFEVTDACGEVYIIEEEILPSTLPLDLAVQQRPGCEEGFGSVRIGLSTGAISALTITAAPASFPHPLPFDGASMIFEGTFFMNGLPEGNYTIVASNNCGGEVTRNITIQGFDVIQNDIELIPNCGSFNLNIQYSATGSYVESFWLQKYNEATGTWGHPATGVAYIEGAFPTAANSVLLFNNSININLGYTGEFRVLRIFHVYSNGSAVNQRCSSVVETFTFDGAPVITDAYSFPCANGLVEVAVVATGVAPLTYQITTMDGDPFVVDNGTSNLFSGLEPATYNFRVTDVCGSSKNILLDVDALDPIAIEAEGFCDGEPSALSVQDFSFVTYEWWNADDPSVILSTFNTLAFPTFNSATDSGTYVVSMTSDNPDSCMNQILEYEVVPNQAPNAGTDASASLCNDGAAINLENYLTGPHDTGGTWEDVDGAGGLTGNTLATGGISAGTYDFRYTVANSCGATDEAIVTLQFNETPAAPDVAIVAPVCEGNDVQLSVTEVAGVAYEWNGPNGFSSNLPNPVITAATAAASGTYTVTATANGCESAPSEVVVTVTPPANAGPDDAVTLCNEGNTVNLEDYLGTPHSTGGTWEDIDGSGGLTGNMFDTGGIPQGTYSFRYTVNDACGGSDEAVITVALNDIPAAPVADAVAPVCEGADVQLSVTPAAGATYAWAGPNGFSSNIANPVITGVALAAGGTYTVTATVNGCTSAAAQVVITINPAPVFSLVGDTSLCEGQTGMLEVMDAANFDINDAVFTWYHNNDLQDGVTGSSIEILETGEFRVVVEANGCQAERTLNVTANTNAFAVEAGHGCIDDEYTIWVANADELPGAQYEWAGPGGFAHSGSEPEVIITGLLDGEYTVTVTNADGCSAGASVQVTNPSCMIPRGISPEDASHNNSFDLTHLGVKHIKIFNRYGLEVYEKSNYKNEWHGQSDKGDLPAGTYYYMLELPQGKSRTGWVYLQREE